MEENNDIIKRGRGRPPTYLTEEDRKDAIKKSKAKYMAKKKQKKIRRLRIAERENQNIQLMKRENMRLLKAKPNIW